MPQHRASHGSLEGLCAMLREEIPTSSYVRQWPQRARGLDGIWIIAGTPKGGAVERAKAPALTDPYIWGIKSSRSLGKGFAQFVLSDENIAACEVSS
jgi:hypothetical protein